MMEFNLFRIPSSSRVLLVSAIFSLANALPRSGPDPTASYKSADWNPRPTSLPESLPELLKRDGPNASICGWVGGNLNQPVACASGAKCVYDTSHGMVGCCPSNGTCTTGVYTTCVETAQGALNPTILTCSGGSVCYQNMFPGGYFQYACGASSDTKTIATTYSGQDWASPLQVIYTQLNLATTQASSSSLAPAPSSAESSTLLTTTSAPSQSSISTTLPVTRQSVASMSAATVSATVVATVAATGLSSQARAGVIAGSVVGGLAVLFAILALGCGLMRRRRNKKAEERAKSITTREKTVSISSYASSHTSGEVRIHPFSPDDIVSPMSPPQEPATAPLQPVVPLEAPQETEIIIEPDYSDVRLAQPPNIPKVWSLANAEEPYVRRVQLVDRPSIDELVDLPPPWVHPPTPPPRSPKRLSNMSIPHGDQTPLDNYLISRIAPLQPSASVKSNTSDTSRYSRNTDGRSIKSFREPRHDGCGEEKAPPMPITRKPVGLGWYRTIAPVPEKRSSDHVAFQMASDEGVGRSLTGTQGARERRLSEPMQISTTEEVLESYANMSATIYNVRELDITGMESDWVAPLNIKSRVSQPIAVKKQRRSAVPILGVPAAPPPGGRGSRLYEV